MVDAVLVDAVLVAARPVDAATVLLRLITVTVPLLGDDGDAALVTRDTSDGAAADFGSVEGEVEVDRTPGVAGPVDRAVEDPVRATGVPLAPEHPAVSSTTTAVARAPNDA